MLTDHTRLPLVLLVDDEEPLRLVGARLLEAMGFAALTAGNGREALHLFRERRDSIDLVMMDLVMPEMGGIEAYRELRLLAPGVPVVICSGYSDDEVEDEIAGDSRAGFLEKPYRPDCLRELLLDML